jgi:hypothetical protein
METTCQLETGLSWYYVHEREFDQREYPVEKRAALAFEAGREAGKCEFSRIVKRTIEPMEGDWP